MRQNCSFSKHGTENRIFDANPLSPQPPESTLFRKPLCRHGAEAQPVDGALRRRAGEALETHSQRAAAARAALRGGGLRASSLLHRSEFFCKPFLPICPQLFCSKVGSCPLPCNPWLGGDVHECEMSIRGDHCVLVLHVFIMIVSTCL